MDAFLQNLAAALNLDDAQLQPGDRLQDLPNWDSLAILTTLAMLDAQYDVVLAGPEIQSCVTIADLFAKVEAAKG